MIIFKLFPWLAAIATLEGGTGVSAISQEKGKASEAEKEMLRGVAQANFYDESHTVNGEVSTINGKKMPENWVATILESLTIRQTNAWYGTFITLKKWLEEQISTVLPDTAFLEEGEAFMPIPTYPDRTAANNAQMSIQSVLNTLKVKRGKVGSHSNITDLGVVLLNVVSNEDKLKIATSLKDAIDKEADAAALGDACKLLKQKFEPVTELAHGTISGSQTVITIKKTAIYSEEERDALYQEYLTLHTKWETAQKEVGAIIGQWKDMLTLALVAEADALNAKLMAVNNEWSLKEKAYLTAVEAAQNHNANLNNLLNNRRTTAIQEAQMLQLV